MFAMGGGDEIGCAWALEVGWARASERVWGGLIEGIE